MAGHGVQIIPFLELTFRAGVGGEREETGSGFLGGEEMGIVKKPARSIQTELTSLVDAWRPRLHPSSPVYCDSSPRVVSVASLYRADS